MKVAERVFVVREPVSFRELCETMVPANARYVVFDLDRTLHFGRNIGELLGWELTALEGYGERYLNELEPARGPGRFMLRWRGLLRYLWASRQWIPPGIFYWFWCRAASRLPLLRRLAFALFGDEPVAAVQRSPQHALFRQMARHDPAEVRELIGRVLRRCEPDLIVEREDLHWLRARCPNARFILSSASPGPVVELVAARLGFDEAIFSTPGRINGGREKIRELLLRHPDLPAADSAGFSDNGYGEDASWTTAFTHLASVNGSVPFSPIAPKDSPLRLVCSAAVLTRQEKLTGRLDPRRRVAPGRLELRRADLETLLAPLLLAVKGAKSAFARARLLERAARSCLRAARRVDPGTSATA